MRTRKLNLKTEEQKRLTELQCSINQELHSIRELDEERKRLKDDDIKSMIAYYRAMTDKIDDRRTHIHNFSLQMLAICITGGLVLYTLYAQGLVLPTLFWFIEPVLLVQILFSLYSAFVYGKQSAFNYAFLEASVQEHANKWKWFYRGSTTLAKISTRCIRRSRSFNNTVEPYLEGLHEFVYDYAQETLDTQISNNIQQLYVLRVHNYYKNRFYLELTKIRQWSIYWIFVVPALIAVTYLVSSITGCPILK